MRTLVGRIFAFGGLPMISIITPLVVLPILAPLAGPAGWGSVLAGEGVGTLAAMVISYGWNVIGPARVALTPDPTERAAIYRESLIGRSVVFLAALPVVAAVCWVVAAPDYRWDAIWMGLYACFSGLTFSWYAVGAADPRSIAVYEAVPRVVAAVLATAIMFPTRTIAVYPLLSLAVVAGGLVLFSRRTLRGHGLARPRLREVVPLLRANASPAIIDVAGGGYAGLSLPLVNAIFPADVASHYASADRLYRFGLFVPITLGNALQSWTVEGAPGMLRRRLLSALGIHTLFGVSGLLILGGLGPWVSSLLFQDDVIASRDVCIALGVVFVFVSIRSSLTRHILIPAGHIKTVLHSTYAATVVTIVLLYPFLLWFGPIGGALSILAAEVAATGLQVPHSVRRLQQLRDPAPLVVPPQEEQGA